MKNVLVTGGTGFIGSNLAGRLVEAGCNVRILRRTESDLRAIAGTEVQHCVGDVREPMSLLPAMKGCDTVFHTAAIVGFSRWKKTIQHEVNVVGTRNVVQACLASNVDRLVHTSSVAALGYPKDDELATEETEFNWSTQGGYKFSKLLAEREVLSGIAKGLNAVIVNPSVVVGERDIHFHGGQLIKEMKRGLIPFYVHGGMNVVYVGDVVRGHILAAERGRTGERYILSGHNMTHKEIFRRTAQLVGGRPPFMQLPLPLLRFGARIADTVSILTGIEPLISPGLVEGAGLNNWFSCEKAHHQLGYTVTSFDETILAAYEWYVKNGFLR